MHRPSDLNSARDLPLGFTFAVCLQLPFTFALFLLLLIVNMHYKYRPIWHFSGLQVVLLRELLFRLFYCNCSELFFYVSSVLYTCACSVYQ
jgi:hypothetical protein